MEKDIKAKIETENEEIDKIINSCFGSDYLSFLIALKFEGESLEVNKYIYCLLVFFLLNGVKWVDKLKEVKTTKDLFSLYIASNNEIYPKNYKKILSDRLKQINIFRDKYLSKDESEKIAKEVEALDFETLSELAKQEREHEKAEYKGLNAKEIYKSVYSAYHYLIIMANYDNSLCNELKGFAFKNEKHKLIADSLIRRGVKAILNYRKPNPSIKITYEPNEKLTTLIGKKSRNLLTLVYAPLLPISDNTEIALYSGVEHDYNKRINDIAETQKDLSKGSKEFNELEKEKDTLYSERAEKLKNVIAYEGIYYIQTGDFNAYIDKDNRYLITKMDGDKEIKIARVLPRIWLKIYDKGSIFFTTMYVLFILATKRGGSFTFTYADIKELFKVDGDRFKKLNAKIKETLEDQLSNTILDMDKITLKNGEKIQPKGAMITASPIDKVGWSITFNEAYYKYLLSEEYSNLIDKSALSEFSDRQLKLYTAITEYLYMNRHAHPKDFTYKISRDYLLKYGGYITDYAFNKLDPKTAKSRKNKEHEKLCKDLEIICSYPNEISEKRGGYLLINDISIKSKVFTIMDFYKNDNKEILKDFERCCKINDTPIRK